VTATPVLSSTAPLVYGLAAVLVLAALVLTAIGVRLVRTTRDDHVALGPLEAMGARGFLRADVTARQAVLDEARPTGAEPLAAEGSAVVAVAVAVDPGEPDAIAPEPAPEVEAEGEAEGGVVEGEGGVVKGEQPDAPPAPAPSAEVAAEPVADSVDGASAASDELAPIEADTAIDGAVEEPGGD